MVIDFWVNALSVVQPSTTECAMGPQLRIQQQRVVTPDYSQMRADLQPRQISRSAEFFCLAGSDSKVRKCV